MPRKKFTDEEIEYIIENYKTKTAKQIAIDLNRPYHSIVVKIQKLKEKGCIDRIKPKKYNTYKDARRTYQKKYLKASVDPKFNTPKRYTLEEEKYIIKHYKDKTIIEMAIALNRTTKSVEHKIARLFRNGILKPSKCVKHKWTEKEIALLKQAIKNKTPLTKLKVNHSIQSIYQKVDDIRKELEQ